MPPTDAAEILAAAARLLAEHGRDDVFHRGEPMSTPLPCDIALVASYARRAVEAGLIAAGALMLVHSADSLREKDQIAMKALQAFMRASDLEPGSVTPKQARAALAATPDRPRDGAQEDGQ